MGPKELIRTLGNIISLFCTLVVEITAHWFPEKKMAEYNLPFESLSCSHGLGGIVKCPQLGNKVSRVQGSIYGQSLGDHQQDLRKLCYC